METRAIEDLLEQFLMNSWKKNPRLPRILPVGAAKVL
jgi:hypothetical protein